jgi:peptidoglycan/xylan/chitin deacetylase (PgdA/CDA1 family)
MSHSSAPNACLTLDLESDWSIPNAPDRNPTFDLLDSYVAMISTLDVPVSVFAVGRTIERHPEVIERLRSDLETEFHVHSYRHDMTKSYEFRDEVTASIDAYESFFGDSPAGYRAPQGNIVPSEWIELERAGFAFDASIFPSYRPGVYNNLTAPLTPYVPDVVDALLEIPFAAVPGLRIPVSMNYLKLLGSPFVETIKRVPLPDPLVFDSHLQDYWPTAFHDNLPNPKRTLMTRNIDRAPEMFMDFMEFLKAEGYEFTTVSEVHRRYGR